MGDENPIRTLGDYSKPSHEGYRNTIELLVGNNAVPVRSNTIRLVQNKLSFHGLRSKDPNQHLKDFLKLVDSLNLDEAWTLFKDLLQKVPHHGINLWLQVQIFYDHVNPVTRRTIDQSAGGKLHDRNAKESWALLEDLSLYDNESWNDPRDFAKPVKAITWPQDVQMNKITTSCKIYSALNDTLYCMEDLEQAFFEYASSRTDEAGDARLSKFEANFKQQHDEMTNKSDTVLKAITDRIAITLPSDMVKNLKLSTSPVLSARSYPTEDPQCSTHVLGSINTVTIHPKQQSDSYDDKIEENEEEEKDNLENIHKNDDSCKEEPEAKEQEVQDFDMLPTRSELVYHK
nr:MAK10-like protein [Tanacetum cinerariifolium]